MPTKTIKPRFGYRPSGYEERYPFNDSRVRELAEIAGCEQDPSKVEALARRLADVSGGLQISTYAVDTKTKLAEQHDALKVLGEHARELFNLVESADFSTRRNIFVRYPAAHIDGEVPERENLTGLDLFNRDIEHLNRLRRGIEFALVDIGKLRKEDRGGHPGKPHLDHACRHIATVYEDFSGKKFTYNRHQGSNDLSEFTTDGGLFVATAVRYLYPDATLANLHTAMQKIKRPRKIKRR